jgi:ketosteroid isomerase-like protein
VTEQNIEAVRGLWRAFARGGIDTVLKIADEDVEWIPYGGGGRVYRGHDGLRRFISERDAGEESVQAEPYGYGDYGESVIVYGHVARGGADQRVFWLYRFRDGKLRRFEAFTDQQAAIAAATRTGARA